MAAQISSSIVEGQSTNRPPLFNGTNYGYWKARMRIFIQSQDYALWRVIVKGPHTPTQTVDGHCFPKPEEDWDENDIKMIQLNAKAMNTLYCALDPNEFNRVSTCTSAKEIWDRLEITHEGTSQVKESKISLLVHKYELFKMETNENITDMFTRFTHIINELKNLGKLYTNSELVQKILRALPASWEAKATAIEEAKDLGKLTLDELRGSLLTHELKMQDKLSAEDKKKKTIAFKAAEEDEEESCKSDEEDSDEELAMITRKFRRFYRKRRQGFSKKKPAAKGQFHKERDKETICYECKKPGHFKSDCPLLKKSFKKFKKRAMAATWSDSDESSKDEEQQPTEDANLCLMAQEDEVCLSPSCDFSFEELKDAFSDLMHEFRTLGLKAKNLKLTNSELTSTLNNVNKKLNSTQENLVSAKKEIISLTLNNKNIKERISLLSRDNLKLSSELSKNKTLVDKFTLSSNKLDLILNNQRAVYDKAGLGFKPWEKQKNIFYKPANQSNKNLKFVKPTSAALEIYRFNKNKQKYILADQSLLHCFHTRRMWVPKGTLETNPSGPKKTWVPKSTS